MKFEVELLTWLSHDLERKKVSLGGVKYPNPSFRKYSTIHRMKFLLTFLCIYIICPNSLTKFNRKHELPNIKNLMRGNVPFVIGLCCSRDFLFVNKILTNINIRTSKKQKLTKSYVEVKRILLVKR